VSDQLNERISRADFAKEVSRSRARITQLIGRGQMTGPGEDGLLDAALARREWKNLQSSPKAELDQALRDEPALDLGEEPGDAPEAADLPSYKEARARREAAQAAVAEHELARRLDQLRPKAEVEAAMARTGRAIKDAVPQLLEEQVPTLAERAGISDAEARALLKPFGRKLLQRLAERLTMAAAAEAEGEGDDSAAA